MNCNFSFHCTICFEALDSAERAPVVLPCGHTFICQQCSSRLDKCMECRRPLFTTLQGVNGEVNKENSHGARPRHQRRNSLPSMMSSPPQPTISPKFAAEKRPLSMPKNFVLMSLMESSRWSERDKSKEEKAFEDHDDDVFVRKGVEQLNTDFGTYAVCEREGLTIHESTTNENIMASLLNESSDRKEQKETKEDLNQSMDLSEIFDLSMVVTEDSFDFLGHMSTEAKLVESNDNQEKLPYGRTVQVVDFEDGNAKLARGAGSLQVKPGQLVKVGAARDKACQIEGRMLSLKKQKEEMKLKMKAMEREISILTKKLPEAAAFPFVESVCAKVECEEEADIISLEQKDDVSIVTAATTATLSTAANDDLALSWTGSFICDAANLYTCSRQQMDQEKTVQSHSAPSTPVRRSPGALSSPVRRSAGVDFNSGFSGYGFSGHHSSPRKQPRRQIRRLSAY
mmetsp:Transcript_10837/g.15967  ORF Transcript_10837/g.15967 Transcript_10837/m.15967 type:complete len:456 (-) Transcript_10837:10-1377(-)